MDDDNGQWIKDASVRSRQRMLVEYQVGPSFTYSLGLYEGLTSWPTNLGPWPG